jgi:hypothetical protein
MLIVGNSSFLNVALSISSPLPLGISANGRTSSSNSNNSNGLHNGSPSTSRTLILLIPINIANADDQAYDYGFEEGVAAGLAMDDSSSSKITDCSPMVDHIKIAKCQTGWQEGYSLGIMLE